MNSLDYAAIVLLIWRVGPALLSAMHRQLRVS
jgi:hypothetical protein